MLNIEETPEGREHRSLQDPPLAGFLFQSTATAWLWLVVRVWLGSQWLLLGWSALGLPSASDDWLRLLGAVVHLTLGLALVAGAFVGIAATAGVFATVLASAIPGGFGGDPFQVIAATLLILAWKNAGYIGLDRYLLRFFGAPWWDTQVPHVSRSARAAARKKH
jgi:thiosulfate dehydrogenase [quinone] large subunit